METTLYNGNYYGCSKAEIGRDKVVVIDPVGLSSLLALNDPSVISFFLTCEESIGVERMRRRGDAEASIVQRIENDRVDFANPVLKRADFHIDTADKDIVTLAKEIHELYQKEYQSRNLE